MADKSIISIAVSRSKRQYEKFKADVLAVGVFEDGGRGRGSAIEKIDKKLGGTVSRLRKLGDFEGKPNSVAVLYSGGKIAAERVLLVGLGKSKEASSKTFRFAASKAANEAVKLKAKSMGFILDFDAKKLDSEKIGRAVAEGIHFGGYRYDEFITSEDGKTKKVKSLAATIIIAGDSVRNKKFAAGVKTGQIVGRSQNFARTLANRPANVLHPDVIAAQAKKIARRYSTLSCTVYGEKQLKQKKMGGIIAVGSGSEHKPCMIVLKYRPASVKKISTAPVALVGKAVTFDSGGISLKPSQNMHEMKMDMTGGASVLATMEAAAELKLPVELYGIICSAENIPGAASYRPGDIITTYSGKTVEVLNTDAEGRILLCDGIHQANIIGCKTIIDIATLTGACAVALGKYKAGLMSNDERLSEKLKQAALDSAEDVWQMPCGDEYAEEMKGKISDLKNISNNRYGGACTAAAFLAQFAAKTKWAHLDIAGPMDASDTLKKITQAGSIGFGVRLFISYLLKLTDG